MTTFLGNINTALLVEPDFPIPVKSRNHHSFLPLGLLKIASYLRINGVQVELERYDGEQINTLTDNNSKTYPDVVLVTSLFKYWSSYVKDAVTYYKNKYPESKIIVGGVYDVVEDRIFNYRSYVESCTGNPMSPQELHTRREELFDEMSTLWRQLPHEEEERGLDKWL